MDKLLLRQKTNRTRSTAQLHSSTVPILFFLDLFEHLSADSVEAYRTCESAIFPVGGKSIGFRLKCSCSPADNKSKLEKRFFLPSGKHRVAARCSMFSFLPILIGASSETQDYFLIEVPLVTSFDLGDVSSCDSGNILFPNSDSILLSLPASIRCTFPPISSYFL